MSDPIRSEPDPTPATIDAVAGVCKDTKPSHLDLKDRPVWTLC
ncbi:hypothetical protein AB0877_17975 [Micromonospora sp. NPDC047644]